MAPAFGKYPPTEKGASLAKFLIGTTAHMKLIFTLVIVGASALRLGMPTGALRTGASSRTCGQPHMGLAVGDQFPAEALSKSPLA